MHCMVVHLKNSNWEYADEDQCLLNGSATEFAIMKAIQIAQNINLTVSAVWLASVNVEGFYDGEVDDYLDIDGLTHSAVYLTAVGG